jgi:RNA polymerase sigma-70 factor (ECF subfamily)
MAQLTDQGAPGFEEMALPYLEAVAAFALSLTRSAADADDLVQETFLRAYKGWHTFTPGTECRRWLFTICRNTFIRLTSRRKVELEVLEGDTDAMPAVLGHVDALRYGVGELFDHIEVRPAIRAAVDALPEPHHSIIVLVDLEGLGYEEAAAVLKIPVGTVRSRLYRARRHVQEALIAHARDMGLATEHVSEVDRAQVPPEVRCAR